MGNKRYLKVDVKKIEIELEDVQGCFSGPIVHRGNSDYIRLDPNFMRFWELMAGDELLITVSKVKRVISKERGE